jgi:hypothetical protein
MEICKFPVFLGIDDQPVTREASLRDCAQKGLRKFVETCF